MTIDRLKQAIDETEGIAFAYLYGSFLDRDNFRDIDIGIHLQESAYADRVSILDKLYGKLMGLSAPLDIRILNDAPVTFLFHVLQGRVLELRDEELHCRVFEQTVRSYLDMEPLLRHATREAFGS